MDHPEQTQAPVRTGADKDHIPSADSYAVLRCSDIAPLTAGNVIMGLESLQLFLSIMLCPA